MPTINRITKRTCPECGERTGVPILYGMPGGAMQILADRGLVALGGCVVVPAQPNRACTSCEHTWIGGGRSVAMRAIGASTK